MNPVQFSIGISDHQGLCNVHPLKEGETIIGCDRASDICVLGEAALLPRHILVSPRLEHCWVSTSSGAPLYDENGGPIEAGFVPWGARLRLGHTHFELQVPQSTVRPAKDDNSGNQSCLRPDTGHESVGKPKGAHPLLVMLLLITIVFLGSDLLATSASPSASLPVEQVDLFAVASACSSANAAHRAEQAQHAALAKSERSVFYLQDGVAAVALFEEASACYKMAGASSLAQRNSELASNMRQSLTHDYKRMRLRLERALATGQNQVASEQVRQLQELLHHQPQSPTSLALRHLALRLSRKN